jgi:hypothetical protein
VFLVITRSFLIAKSKSGPVLAKSQPDQGQEDYKQGGPARIDAEKPVENWSFGLSVVFYP